MGTGGEASTPLRQGGLWGQEARQARRYGKGWLNIGMDSMNEAALLLMLAKEQLRSFLASESWLKIRYSLAVGKSIRLRGNWLKACFEKRVPGIFAK